MSKVIADLGLDGENNSEQLDITQLLGENARLKAQIGALRQEVHRLTKLADTDTLTSLANRRAFDRELERTIWRRKRYGTPAAVIFVDVDQFKALNDVHGHHVGDASLMFIANAMKSMTRRMDVVARVGGDEFALILDHLQEDTARAKAAYIVEMIERTSRTTFGIGSRIKLSWGLAIVGERDTTSSVLARADTEMYAKRAAQRSER